MAKLELIKIVAENNGSIESKQMEIGDQGLIFEILISKIYENGLVAMCREIASNSRDSHIECGTPEKPIFIKLPTYDDMNITFKDEGLGIDKDRMYNIFCNLGKSSKRNSQDQTGMFGIGGKSPFAVSPQFTVKSITQEGKKKILRTYSLFINEARMGQCDLISETETSEHTGTSVIVPLKRDQINPCKEAIIKASQFWDPRPNCSEKLNYQQYTILHESKGLWQLYEPKTYSYYDNSKAIAIIGGISYDLDSSKLPAKYADYLNHPFFLIFKTGEISLSASRDHIHFDQKTEKAIVARFELISKELGESISNKIKSAATYQDAVKLYNQTTVSFKNKNLISTLSSVKWNGYTVYPNPSVNHINPAIGYTTYTYNRGKIVGSGGGITAPSFLQSDYYLFYHDDKGVTRPRSYAEQLFAETKNQSKSIVIIYTPETVKNEKGEDVKAKYDLSLLDLFNVPKLSSITLTKKEKAKRTSTKNNDVTVSVYDLYGGYGGKFNHYGVTEIPNTEGVYVVYDYEKHTIEGFDHSAFGYNFSFDKIVKFLGVKVWGITATRSKKLNPKWKTLQQTLDAKIESLLKEISIKDLQLLCKDFPVAKDWVNNQQVDWKTSKSKLNKDCALVKAFDQAQDIMGKYNKYELFMEFLRVYKKEKDLVVDYYNNRGKHTSDMVAMIDKVKKNYPLLQFVQHYNDSAAQSAIIHYINGIWKDGEK